MDAFFYYSDLIAQTCTRQAETTTETAEIAQAHSEKNSWLIRIGQKLAQWLIVPVPTEVEEAYYEGRILLPLYPY